MVFFVFHLSITVEFVFLACAGFVDYKPCIFSYKPIGFTFIYKKAILKEINTLYIHKGNLRENIMSDFLKAVGNGALLGAGLSLMSRLSPWGGGYGYGMGMGYGMGFYTSPLLMFGS